MMFSHDWDDPLQILIIRDPMDPQTCAMAHSMTVWISCRLLMTSYRVGGRGGIHQGFPVNFRPYMGPENSPQFS